MKTATSHRKKSQRRHSRKWSAHVTRTSHAMDLKPGVFSGNNPKKIAASIKRSSESSTHRKSNPYHSAISMVTFYLNRAGRNLPAKKKSVLKQTKDELRHQFGRA